jgi:hypothetical protein
MNIKQINFARKHAAYCNYYRNFSKSHDNITPRQYITAGAAAASIPAAIAANDYLEKMGHNGILGVWKDAYNTYNENKALPPHIMTGNSSFPIPDSRSAEEILYLKQNPTLIPSLSRIGNKINADYIANGVNTTPTHLSASDVVTYDGNLLSQDAIASLNKFGANISNTDWLNS